jgi:hypothetical protein
VQGDKGLLLTVHIPVIPRGALLIYSLGSQEASRATVGVLEFNAWGPFLADGFMPGPRRSALAASSEQDSAAREVGPEALRNPKDDVDSGERSSRRGRSQSIVVLLDSSDDDEATTTDQPTGGDVAASSSRDLEEEERQAH